MRSSQPCRASGTLAILAAVLTAAAACAGESSEPSAEMTDAAAAYQALVTDVATCGMQVAECARAAAPDPDAVAQCADQLADCASAGAAAVSAIAGAATACAAQMRECVNAGGDGEDCSVELRACLGVGGASDPDPAGTPPDGTPAAGLRDCAADLQGCVAAGTDPASCAEQIRACVLDALPVPADLMPGAPPAAAPANPGGAAPPIPDPAPPVPPSVPAAPPAGQPVPGELPVPDDLPEPAGAAISCLEALHACVSAGDPPPSCLQQMQECMMSAHP